MNHNKIASPYILYTIVLDLSTEMLEFPTFVYRNKKSYRKTIVLALLRKSWFSLDL